MRNIRTLFAILVPHNLTWSSAVKSRIKLGTLTLRVVYLIFWRVSLFRLKTTFGFAKYASKVHKDQGPGGLAKFLKVNAVLLQQVAGGHKADSPWALGANVARTRSGIPRLITWRDREAIRKGDRVVIRYWLTLFGLYREIEFKGALKLKTITNPSPDSWNFQRQWMKWVPLFWKLLKVTFGNVSNLNPSKDLVPDFFPDIRKSSPNSGGWPAVVGLPLDILAWLARPELLRDMAEWLQSVRADFLVSGLKPVMFIAWINLAKNLKRWGKPLHLGKLGFKREPGKIRVFAMVDILTQAVMKPLHDWIFRILRVIPQDGTFNQVQPVERLLEWMASTGRTWSASYDLSAATDRLPIIIQEQILAVKLGLEKASLWGRILVDREYALPRIAKSYNVGMTSVRYTVGQPMGALSSWAMLALTHHAIVQYAAYRVNPRVGLAWFPGYALLGDDIVIADKAVAKEYLWIMSALGVEIGIAKSLISNSTSIEFAKRTWIHGREASPIALAEALVAMRNLESFAELLMKCKRFGEIRLASVARFAGFGYRNLGRLPAGLGLGNRMSRLFGYLSRPNGVIPLPFEEWVTSIGLGSGAKARPHLLRLIAESVWRAVVKALDGKWNRLNLAVRGGLAFVYLDGGKFSKDQKIRANERVRSVGNYAPLPYYLEVERRKRKGACLIRPLSWVSTELFFDNESLNRLVNTTLIRPNSLGPLNSLQEVKYKLAQWLDPGFPFRWPQLARLWDTGNQLVRDLAVVPGKVNFFERDQEEVPRSSRLVTQWVLMRSLVERELLLLKRRSKKSGRTSMPSKEVVDETAGSLEDKGDSESSRRTPKVTDYGAYMREREFYFFP